MARLVDHPKGLLEVGADGADVRAFLRGNPDKGLAALIGTQETGTTVIPKRKTCDPVGGLALAACTDEGFGDLEQTRDLRRPLPAFTELHHQCAFIFAGIAYCRKEFV